MNIIGINAHHGDSSACLVVDGQLICAVEEERFNRVKHWAGFPIESIKYCMKESNLEISDIDEITVNTNPKENIFLKVKYLIRNCYKIKIIRNKLKARKQKNDILGCLMLHFPNQEFNFKIHYIEHHLAHLASSYLVSPFDQCVGVSIDGFGDFCSAAWGYCADDKIDIIDRVNFPHSLGLFYESFSQYLGFKNYGDEYKVMGLAPYGKPTYIKKLRQLVKLQPDGKFRLNLKYYRHHNEDVKYEWSNSAPTVGCLLKNDLIEDLIDLKPRSINQKLTEEHKDLASSVQAMYEEAFFNILNTLYKQYKINYLTLSGGCAMNSVANGKIYRQTKFTSVYIQPAAGDAGGAIGAAFMVANQLGETKERFRMDHACWGPSFDNNYHKKLLSEHQNDLKREGCKIEWIKNEEELCKRTAQVISEGQVIGWFQGRMEWGPRALGNRSILCDPRRADMMETLNLKIKRRESFRPFAPSILREKVSEWFQEDEDVPFMMQVFQIHENKRKIIPAVTHVDGSGRLQTVSRSTNPRYYKLISAFDELTGVPILLNTSFNENEPIVCKPEEALNTFLRTKIDLLVLGNWFVYRKV